MSATRPAEPASRFDDHLDHDHDALPAAYVVRSRGRHPERKVRVPTDLLIEYFGKPPHRARSGR